MSNQLHRYRIVLDYIEPWLDEQDEATLKQIYADLLVISRERDRQGQNGTAGMRSTFQRPSNYTVAT